MPRFQQHKSTTLRLERLENRELMAGDVTASVVNGDLLLSEAAGQSNQENSVEISRLPNGLVRVTGGTHISDTNRSKINGAAFKDFAVTGNLTVNFAGGSDKVVFVPSGAGIPNVLSFRNVQINTAKPASSSRSDNDVISITNVNVAGSLTVNTGAGNDSIRLSEGISAPLALGGNLDIKSGAGADTVSVSKLTTTPFGGFAKIQTFDALTEADIDNVSITRLGTNGSIGVSTGGGKDTVNILNTNSRSLDVNSGAGDDTVTMDGVQAFDSLFASLGEGSDTLSFKNVHPLTHLIGFLDGGTGAGTDSIWTQNVDNLFSQFSLTNWEKINGRIVFKLDPTVLNNLPVLSPA